MSRLCVLSIGSKFVVLWVVNSVNAVKALSFDLLVLRVVCYVIINKTRKGENIYIVT